MHKTIGVYNNKGGVGKTTMSSHLAWYAEYQEIPDVLIMMNMSGRGGKRMDFELRKAIAAIPQAKLCDVVVQEADAITRTTDFNLPAWEVPYGSGTAAAATMESMCRSVLTHAGFKMKKRRINAEQG